MAVDIISRPMGRQPQRGEAWSGYSAAWTIIGTLLGGMVAWGGIGYLIDRLVGTEDVFLAIGLIVGTAGGIYLVYLRYGRENDAR
jgi:ATP synthase protein I